MNFNEAYNYLIGISNIEHREYMKDPCHCLIYIKRLQKFLNILGNPEKYIAHYIHITGTSGKGSVCAMLHSIINASGKKVGSTYSPHPTYITERWKIGNRYMSRGEFCFLVEYIKPKVEEYLKISSYDMLSFFELAEAIGFLWFMNNNVEWAILEAGCGGRYDASNVIPYKDIAIITNVSIDHTHILGDTKEKIAFEKAGIIKKGCRAYTMEKNKKVLDILEKECAMQKVVLERGVCKKNDATCKLSVLGKHQIKNAGLAISIARFLEIKESDIKKGLREVKLPLRMEIISKKPFIILDSAHNFEKMKTTVETMDSILNGRDCHIILAFSYGKEVEKMVKQISSLNPKSVVCTIQNINPFRQAISPQIIYKYARKYIQNAKIEIFSSAEDSFLWSKEQAGDNDVILVTGSGFLSGQLREVG